MIEPAVGFENCTVIVSTSPFVHFDPKFSVMYEESGSMQVVVPDG